MQPKKLLTEMNVNVTPEIYEDGFGQLVLVHPKEICTGHHCCIHNPSDHPYRQYPTYWDNELKLMYRVLEACRVIDPDELAYQHRRLVEVAMIVGEFKLPKGVTTGQRKRFQ